MEFMGTKEAAEKLNVNSKQFRRGVVKEESLMPSRTPMEVLGEFC